MAYSDNLVSWETISRLEQLNGLRDGYMIKIEDRYYIIGTGALYVTTDFYSFEKLDYLKDDKNYKNVWAPEIFKDTNGKYHIVYCAGDAEAGILNDYIADFDPQTNKITNEGQAITFKEVKPCKLCQRFGVSFLDPNAVTRNRTSIISARYGTKFSLIKE